MGCLGEKWIQSVLTKNLSIHRWTLNTSIEFSETGGALKSQERGLKTVSAKELDNHKKAASCNSTGITLIKFLICLTVLIILILNIEEIRKSNLLIQFLWGKKKNQHPTHTRKILKFKNWKYRELMTVCIQLWAITHMSSHTDCYKSICGSWSLRLGAKTAKGIGNIGFCFGRHRKDALLMLEDM